ncbi:MAG: SCP2 sterol-binding domain-containing protein [Ktedonobacterales bacterium]
MSTGQQGQVTQQASATTAASRVDEFFKMVAATKDQPRLRFVSGVVRFDIEGAGSWRVEVKEGAVAVSEPRNDTSPVDVVVTTTADVMARILAREGNMNFFAALLQEVATVRGDPAFALAVLLGATFDQAALGAR